MAVQGRSQPEDGPPIQAAYGGLEPHAGPAPVKSFGGFDALIRAASGVRGHRAAGRTPTTATQRPWMPGRARPAAGVSPCGITCPPWEIEGVDDYLPGETAEASGENRTEPLDPTVIGPLLTWSIRLVEDFSDDILAAWAERRRMHAVAKANKSTREGLAAVRDYLMPLIDSGALLPATVSRKHGVTLAYHYVAAVTGASWNQVHHLVARCRLLQLTAQRPGPARCRCR
jgi:hypothetical protein